MASGKVFVVIEALDAPAGAMLARYQIVERIELDPEEQRLAAVPPPPAVRPPGIPADDWALVQIQLEAAEAIYKNRATPPRPSYRTDEKMVVCQKPEEIAEAIREAKESYDEIRKLTKAGARFEFSPSSLRAL
jgi:hypothetical protein